MSALDDLPAAITNAETEVGPVDWQDGLGGQAYDNRFARLEAARQVAEGNDDMTWALFSEHALGNVLRTDDWLAEDQALRGRILRTAALLCVWIDQIDERFAPGEAGGQ